jgi:pilus assembly protein CpaB
MSRVRLIAISLVALMVAVGAFVVARTAAAPKAPKPVVVAPVAVQQVRVLVAARDLPVGERIDPAALTWEPWPATAVQSGAYITDGPPTSVGADSRAKLAAAAGEALGAAKSAVVGPDAKLASYAGSVVREHISAHEPILETKLVHAGAGGVMAVTLTPGMRAMSVPLTPETAAGGFILPGDHVDVVQIRRADGAIASSTVMKNVRVLAIDQNLNATPAKSGGAAQVGATATLELAPEQAEDMVLAKAQGDLTLVLRSYADAAGEARTGEIRRTNTQPVVRIFRNGAETEVKVAR